MQADRQGFGHGGQRKIEALRQQVGLRAVDDQLVAERPLHMRHAHGAAVKTHVQALVGHALLAIAARPAGARGGNRHGVLHPQVLDCGASLGDHARDLMAQHHGLLDAYRAKATLVVVMKIGATDATVSDPDTQLVRAQGLGGQVLDAQVVGRMTDEGGHDGVPGFRVGR